MTLDQNPYEPSAAAADLKPSKSTAEGPTVRIGACLCVFFTMTYWYWESRAGGNIRVDLIVLYPLLFGFYLYSLQRLGWFSILIAVALMAGNIVFFAISYSLFDKPVG